MKIGKADLWRYTGLTAMYRWLKRNSISIVAVHGVIDPERSTWHPLRWQLDVKVLRQYLRVLTKKYEFVTASEAVAMMNGEVKTRKNCAVFTIDDGYVNSLNIAVPVLEEFNIRPVIFVATDHCENNRLYWFDRLDRAIQWGAAYQDSVNFCGEEFVLKGSNRKVLSATCKSIIYKSRVIFEAERDRIAALEKVIAELEQTNGGMPSALGGEDDAIAVMRPAHILECVARGCEIGSHTVNHMRLPYLSEQERTIELRESKRYLEELLGIECKFFCYPEASCTPKIAQQVIDAGYQAAFTMNTNWSSPNLRLAKIDRIHLPANASANELLTVVSGLSRELGNLKAKILGRQSLIH